MVIAFAHGPMGRRIDPSWSGPIELFLVPGVTKAVVCAILSVIGVYKTTLAVNRKE